MTDLEKFSHYLAVEEKSILTQEKYLRDASAFLAWLGDQEISKEKILDYKAELVANYAPSSVNSMLSSINAFMVFLGREEYKVRTLKQQQDVFSPEEKELTQCEYQRLLQAARDDQRLYLLMQTICATGIRVSEYRFVTVEAVRQGRASVRSKGKLRTVLIPQKLCKLLSGYCRQQGIRSGSIFITSGGRPLDRSRIWAQMKKLCKLANVSPEKVFPHNLRHLFARTFYSMEKDIVRLADILGHSSVNTTRIYTRESGHIHRMQIEKMPLLYIT